MTRALAARREDALIECLAGYRNEEPARTRAWLEERKAVLDWMRELQGKVGQ